VEDKVNYTRVGAFVLVLGALLVAGVLWLAAGVGSRREVDRYQAFIEESVAGLNVDAPVKYLGVDVGKVGRIEIDPHNSRRVRLVFVINRGTPIKQDSEAVLKTQGLTGIAYVELSGGSVGSPALAANPDGVPPTIPFKLSLSARLESVMTHVLGNVDRVSNNFNAVFDADNRQALKSTLADLASLAHALEAQKGVLTRGIADAARTAQLAASASQRLAPTLASITSGAQSVERMADGVSATSLRATRAADSAASAVQQASSETLPDLERLMAELTQLSASLRALSEQTARSPSSLVVGRPLPQPGPGESTPP
jgi:phospholipid/cholesterol/gamma-HCH transport system substrate-binding protein